MNGDSDGVRFWDVQSLDAWVLRGHRSYVYCVFLLLSCSGDHTVRIWDTQSLKDRVQARHERQTILADVEPMVERLFAELGDAGKVVERVKADVLLSARARQIALQVALRMSLDRINATARELPPDNRPAHQRP